MIASQRASVASSMPTPTAASKLTHQGALAIDAGCTAAVACLMIAADGKSKAEKARAAAVTKATRKAVAGLSRTVKLRLYPMPDQIARVNRSIGTTRFVWNTIWLPMLQGVERARVTYAKANGETKEAWREAYRLHPDPSETDYNRARIAASKPGDGREWIAEAELSPLSRAARSFADAVKASRGRTRAGNTRKVRAGRVQPRSRRDDNRQGLEWQLQSHGKDRAPLGGKILASVIDLGASVVTVPSLGAVRFEDRCRLLKSYLAAGVEACEITVKRDGTHYYACIAVRGLQPAQAHIAEGIAVGIDMGIVNPLATSDGEFVTHHQGHDIKSHMARLERKKLRAKRQYSRKLHACAARAGALTETGSFKKGVPIRTSNRMRRLVERQNKIDRQIVGYRSDWQCNSALEIARRSEIIVVEALTLKNMTASAAGTMQSPGRNVRAKAALNRALLARGFGSMRQRLKTKAEEQCGRVIEVDPAYTSQTCPRCGHVARKNRINAQFACLRCQYAEHADIVGATNILQRGISAGAPPATGRGGLATGSPPSGGDAERAATPGNRTEPSNKSSREPEVSDKGAEGSRGAKPHNAHNELVDQPAASRDHQHEPSVIKPGGSRNAPD